LPARMQGQFVDLHCHCLPGLGDGPGSTWEALMLCRALAADNIEQVVATPHQLGGFEARTDVRRVCQKVQHLNRELGTHGINLKVLPGAEVRLDEWLGDLLAGRQILTLADVGRHILLDFPETVFIDIEPLADRLRTQGVEIIVAHPERNAPLLARPQTLQRWVDGGVTLQVTAASLMGRFGPAAARAAWKLIADGTAAIVATDARDRGAGSPCMTPAFKMISDHLGLALARHLCIENPSRVLRGESLAPVPVQERQEIS
jgi:protein-tyrosine phosphatase